MAHLRPLGQQARVLAPALVQRQGGPLWGQRGRPPWAMGSLAGAASPATQALGHWWRPGSPH